MPSCSLCSEDDVILHVSIGRAVIRLSASFESSEYETETLSQQLSPCFASNRVCLRVNAIMYAQVVSQMSSPYARPREALCGAFSEIKWARNHQRWPLCNNSSKEIREALPLTKRLGENQECMHGWMIIVMISHSIDHSINRPSQQTSITRGRGKIQTKLL